MLIQKISFFVAVKFFWAVSNIRSIIFDHNSIGFCTYFFWKLGFYYATLYGAESEYGSNLFASSRFWAKSYAKDFSYKFTDDLQSLVYTIWYIEGVNYSVPSGAIINLDKYKQGFLMVSIELNKVEFDNIYTKVVHYFGFSQF